MPSRNSKRAHSPRRLNGDISVGYTYDLMNRYKTGAPIYQVSPKHLPEFVDIFADKAARLSSLGISSADLGSVLGADFSASEPVGRPQAEALHTAALEALCGQFPVKLNAPNLYAWRFADSIACLPTDDSWYSIVNESVPLTPMVLSGLIPYTASPLNLAPDYRTALLEAVEYGAGLNYLLMDREPGLLKETAYNYYTTGKASDWIPIAAQDYQKANALLKNTVGQQIVRHVRLDSELYRTDYANGICVYVNYADAAVRYQNLEIGAKDYRVVEP